MAHDPRSEAEKARAALKRNSELGTAVPESPLERQPSVTPDTFGDHTDKARVQSGLEGVEAGGVTPDGLGREDASESLADAEQGALGRDRTHPVANRPDVMNRAGE